MSLRDDVRVEDLVGEAEREDFIRNGFFSLKRIAEPAEVALIRSELLGLLDRKAGFEEGALTDLVTERMHTRVSCSQGRVQAASRCPPHRSTTGCPSMTRENEAPTS